MPQRPQKNPASEPIVVDEITLDGKSVQVRNMDLPLDTVQLDPRNPRIANTVAFELNVDEHRLQRRLADLLWSDDDVKDLLRQVYINKGLIERIIVREDRTVVEGNCRTVVYRKLNEKYPDEPRWQRIPARILPADIRDRDVAILLGEMHVAGKNSWTPFEKAGHIFRLHKDFALSQDEIAGRLRMSKSKINQLIRAFDAMKNRFLPGHREPGAIRKFSYFEELFKKPELREWVANDSRAVDDFVEWVATKKLSEGVQVRELPAILANAEALAALRGDGFAAAKKIIQEENPALTVPLFRRMVEMTEALEQAQLDDIRRVRKGQQAQTIGKSLRTALERFVEFCEIG